MYMGQLAVLGAVHRLGILQLLLRKGVHVVVVPVRGHCWWVGGQRGALPSGLPSSLCSQQPESTLTLGSRFAPESACGLAGQVYGHEGTTGLSSREGGSCPFGASQGPGSRGLQRRRGRQ